ncbi:MAG: helix-turn-helix domain-containing protein [Actinobacteria bacterium]|nr:MAG: helix-turn-helix domain-containing protein [Actinomycetota bacterium]
MKASPVLAARRPVIVLSGSANRRDPHRALGIAAPAPLGSERAAMDPLLTAGEVAGLLQVSTAWVYAQTRAKKIPHVPLGRYVRYRRSAVIEWVAALEQQSSTCVAVKLGDR